MFVGDGRYREMMEVPTTDSLLFGDGSSATAVEIEKGNPLFYAQKTDGERYQLIFRSFVPTIIWMLRC